MCFLNVFLTTLNSWHIKLFCTISFQTRISNGLLSVGCVFKKKLNAASQTRSIIGMDFFLKLIYYTMRWATWTALVHCHLMSLRITLDIQTTATKIASLFPLTQCGEDLRIFMWHSTQIRCTLIRITPTAWALISWRTLKHWAVKTSSENPWIFLNVYQ